jgi:hypothetical protein
MMQVARVHLRLSAFLVLAACGSAADGTPVAIETKGGPVLALADSVILQEGVEDFLAIPSAITTHPLTGELFVGDPISGKVLSFATSGALTVRARGGSGPGEFKAPGPIAFLADGTVAIVDWARDVILLVDSAGTELHRIPLSGYAYSLFAGGGDTLFAGVLNRQPPYTSLRIIVTTSGAQHPAVMAPDEYAESSQLRVMNPHVSVVRTGDHLVVGYSGSNLLHDSTPGEPMRAFEIPLRHRRRLPANLLEQYSKPLPDSIVAGMASVLTWLFPLANNRLMAVHMDYTLNGRSLTASGWISVVDLTTRQGCVDAVLSVSGVGKPVLATHGDTLLVLEQRATATGDPESVVFKYTVSDSGCVWRDLEEVAPASSS